MMVEKQKETGGPAFPMGSAEAAMYANCLDDLEDANLDKAEQTHLSATAIALCGMTLRDYFAAKAMQGELACQHDEYKWYDINKLAAHCYRVADSMLKAREQ